MPITSIEKILNVICFTWIQANDDVFDKIEVKIEKQYLDEVTILRSRVHLVKCLRLCRSTNN